MRVQLLGILDTDDWEERGEKVREVARASMDERVGGLASILIELIARPPMASNYYQLRLQWF